EPRHFPADQKQPGEERPLALIECRLVALKRRREVTAQALDLELASDRFLPLADRCDSGQAHLQRGLHPRPVLQRLVPRRLSIRSAQCRQNLHRLRSDDLLAFLAASLRPFLALHLSLPFLRPSAAQQLRCLAVLPRSPARTRGSLGGTGSDPRTRGCSPRTSARPSRCTHRSGAAPCSPRQ